MPSMNSQALEVFAFWFPPEAAPDAPRPEWFKKDDQFDRQIADRFGDLVAQALAGGVRHWDAEGPPASLARILLLDQFPRNIYRGTPLAFAGDHQALQAAQDMVDAGDDLLLSPFQRAFVYIPFEHAEELAMQQQSVALFTRLAALQPALDDMLDYARRHRDVILRFGRFPHRNAILHRVSTPEEEAFLAQPGSRF